MSDSLFEKFILHYKSRIGMTKEFVIYSKVFGPDCVETIVCTAYYAAPKS